MVGGQAIDLGSVGVALDQAALEVMHRHKTGALIEASVRLGALASGRAEPAALAALERYAEAIGPAFQVQDDILDVESDTATSARPGQGPGAQQADLSALLGLEAAKGYALELRDLAGRPRRFSAERRPAAPTGPLHRRATQLTDGSSEVPA